MKRFFDIIVFIVFRLFFSVFPFDFPKPNKIYILSNSMFRIFPPATDLFTIIKFIVIQSFSSSDLRSEKTNKSLVQ